MFKSAADTVLYVGKAKNLRNRVGQYLSGHDSRHQIPALLEESQYLEVIALTSEKEAYVLENNLIKKNNPKYNIDLKDDKTYPYIALTKDKYPSLIITRKPEKNYQYIKGPFTDTTLLRKLYAVLKVVYPLRMCKKLKKTCCINHQINLCPAPCEHLISDDDYRDRVNKIAELLSGKNWKAFSDEILKKMENASENLNFEAAAKFRDSLKIIPEIREKLGVEFNFSRSSDYFLFSYEYSVFFIIVATVRDGKLERVKSFYSSALIESYESAAISSISSYYKVNPIPKKIGIEGADSISQELLSEILSKNISISRTDKELVAILRKNQAINISNFLKHEGELNSILISLSAFLGKDIFSIQCLDVSTLYGEYNVVGAVWWEKGSFVKKNYRRFRIKNIDKIDDFASLEQACERLKSHWDKDWPVPDLLLIDGGKGQLSSVLKVVDQSNVLVAGIIKDRRHVKGSEKLITADDRELTLTNSPLALLIMKVRDETHRFSIEYNRMLRKNKIKTFLTDIPGLGPSREKILLNYFRSANDIKSATLDELKMVKGIPVPIAINIFNYIHNGGKL